MFLGSHTAFTASNKKLGSGLEIKLLHHGFLPSNCMSINIDKKVFNDTVRTLLQY